MKNVLIAFTHHSRRTFSIYPHLLQRAGLSVTIIAHPKFKIHVGRGYTKWIDGSDQPDALIKDIATRFSANENAYDWVILGDDNLLCALSLSDMPATLKTRIGPIGKAEYIPMMTSKFTTSQMVSSIGIQVAPSKSCKTLADIHSAIQELGLPVIIKPDQGLGSEGVVICRTSDEVDTFFKAFADNTYIVEKYISGQRVRVDPLFYKGQLISANASLMQHTIRGELGVSTQRRVLPAKQYVNMLTKLGAALQLSGFMNIGGIQETTSGEFYLFELDCRPNEWPAMIDVFEVDISKAILDYNSNSQFPPLAHLSPDNQRIARSFVREIPYLVRKIKFGGLIDWLINKDKCWQCLPRHDVRLLLFWFWLVARECAHDIICKILKTFGLLKTAHS